jgi:hypothetical protein
MPTAEFQIINKVGRVARKGSSPSADTPPTKTIADVVRDSRKAATRKSGTEALGAAARGARTLDRVKLLELQSHTPQTIPTREQVAAKGGGVGGYLRAWRELNS